MTNEELVSLIQQGENVSENMGILYQQNIRFIQSEVNRYNIFADNDDLMQEAYFALKESVEKCDLSHKAPFLALLKVKIKSYCLRYADKNDNGLSIHSYMPDRIKKYKRLIDEYGGVPDAETVMQKLNLSRRQYDLMIQTFPNYGSLDSFDRNVTDDDDLSLGDIVSGSISVEESFFESEKQKKLSKIWECVDSLDERKRNIIYLLYKLNLTQTDVAMNYGISRQNVKIIMDNALYLLRQMEKVQELAELYDYDCSFAYMPCLQAMKNGKPSNVERIVLKRIGMEERLDKLKRQFLMKEGGTNES
ncbi:MAG: sigma-70 family RNA polymerase sigma factor [Acutalibacteraceae bacterium]|nr:sigma-70 family RNA polymerase sigma factor [Acutalibacteraceae bacterium]